MLCRAIAPPAADPCGLPATHRVMFRDGDVARVCQECALRLELLANSHGTVVRVDRIQEP